MSAIIDGPFASRSIGSILVIMKCPVCNSEDAYTGLLWIHCRNKKCRYYDKAYDEQKNEERSRLRPEQRLRLMRELMDLNNQDLFGP